MECIMEFRLEGRHFKFMGEGIAIEDGELRFDSLSLLECVNGEFVAFEVKATTFSGHKLNVYDVFDIEIARFTQKYKDQEMVFMHEKVVEYIDGQLPNKDTFDIAGRALPLHILHGFGVCELLFATDQFLYYSNDDYVEMVMFNTDMELLSDNCFAETGFFDSLSAVAKGVESIAYIREADRAYIEEQLREQGWIKKEEGNGII